MVLQIVAYGRKSKYYELPTMPLPSSFSKGANEGKHSSESKRVTVLNKVFMRYVTELMATGENCSLYLGHNIQVNYVSICHKKHRNRIRKTLSWQLRHTTIGRKPFSLSFNFVSMFANALLLIMSTQAF